jgi:hypothetical protein
MIEGVAIPKKQLKRHEKFRGWTNQAAMRLIALSKRGDQTKRDRPMRKGNRLGNNKV